MSRQMEKEKSEHNVLSKYTGSLEVASLLVTKMGEKENYREEGQHKVQQLCA